MEDKLNPKHPKKSKLYIDMDGVMSDFRKSSVDHGNPRSFYSPSCMYKPGFFENMPVIEPALDAVRALIRSNKYDVMILTQPLANSPISYTEKVNWVMKHFPELKDRIIMTQDKSLIKGDFLIDDNPKWESFEGEFIFFDPDANYRQTWDDIVKRLT